MAHDVRFFSLMRCLLVLLGLQWLAVTPAYADEVPQTLDELKIAIEKVRVESGLPGLGIALVDKNGPYWVAGLGEADKESHRPVDTDTLFRIGSTSKMFVALSVLKLVDEGRLDLQAKLSDLLPELYFENPWEATNPILLVHLLEHTTGWDDISPAVYSKQDPNISIKAALDFHPHYRKSRWVPGTRFAYNNAGPVVAAYIVEKITGQRYEDYVQAQFFNPLQMTSTSFFETEAFKERGASLYSFDGKKQPYWHLILRPAGSINSSARDMAQYLQFLIGRGSFNSQSLISEASFTRMETPTTTLGAQAGTTAGYGLHNYVNGFESTKTAFRGHDGDVVGGHCRLSYVPELGVGYVLLINEDNLVALDKIPKLIRTFLTKDIKKPATVIRPLPEQLQGLDGYYLSISPRSDMGRINAELFGVIHITSSDNKLHRMPLLGGWEKPTNDYAASDTTLANDWTGLVTMARVNDPLAGDVLEVSDAIAGDFTLKKVSAIRVFCTLGWIGLTAILSLASIVFAIVWSIRLARGKIKKGAAISVRIWPLVTSLVLFLALFAPNIFQPSIEAMGQVSLPNIIIFICTSLYPLLALYSAFNSYRLRNVIMNRTLYWYSLVLGVLHCGVALCLGYYGLLAIRMWV